jgi:type I restriction enzyme M protein
MKRPSPASNPLHIVRTARVRELALRYEKTLPVLVDEVAALSKKVKSHLAKMGTV